jgi:hypothetical protein
MAELRITKEYVYKAKQNEYNRTSFCTLKHATLDKMTANQQKCKMNYFPNLPSIL